MILKLPLHHTSLGRHLKRARKDRQWTQRALAQQARVSIPTLRLLENGQGNLTSFWAVLHTLSIEITGRNLPKGENIGAQIMTLRKRKGISQSELSKLVGVSPPTLMALERHGTGRLPTLERVLVALGAGASLAPHGSPHPVCTPAGQSAPCETWTTPQHLLERLYRVFGAFDLDPCSPTSGRTAPVRANVHYTEADDGLALPWFGTIFVNPPYGRSLSRWTAKAKSEVAQGHAHVVIALLPARPDTRYWHRDIAGVARVFFLQGRLKFGGTKAVAPFPSCLVVWGASDQVITAIHTTFPEAWLAR